MSDRAGPAFLSDARRAYFSSTFGRKNTASHSGHCAAITPFLISAWPAATCGRRPNCRGARAAQRPELRVRAKRACGSRTFSTLRLRLLFLPATHPACERRARRARAYPALGRPVARADREWGTETHEPRPAKEPPAFSPPPARHPAPTFSLCSSPHDPSHHLTENDQRRPARASVSAREGPGLGNTVAHLVTAPDATAAPHPRLPHRHSTMGLDAAAPGESRPGARACTRWLTPCDSLSNDLRPPARARTHFPIYRHPVFKLASRHSAQAQPVHLEPSGPPPLAVEDAARPARLAGGPYARVAYFTHPKVFSYHDGRSRTGLRRARARRSAR